MPKDCDPHVVPDLTINERPTELPPPVPGSEGFDLEWDALDETTVPYDIFQSATGSVVVRRSLH